MKYENPSIKNICINNWNTSALCGGDWTLESPTRRDFSVKRRSIGSRCAYTEIYDMISLVSKDMGTLFRSNQNFFHLQHMNSIE